MKTHPHKENDNEGTLLLTVFYFFLVLIASYLVNQIWITFYTERTLINLLVLYIPPLLGRKYPNTSMKRASTIVLVLITLFIVLYFSVGLLQGNSKQLEGKTSEGENVAHIPTTTPVPTRTVTVVPILPTVDPDPVVSCRISSNCNGGTMQLRLSRCKKSVCCQIINDKWYLFADSQQCDEAQAKFNELMKQRLTQQRQARQNAIPTLPPIPTFPVLAPVQSQTASTIEVSNTSPIDPSYLYRQCVKSVNDSYFDYINRLGANGAAESSLAIQARIDRDQELGTCSRLYGGN